MRLPAPLALAAALGCAAFCPAIAQAQSAAPPPPSWQFAVTPYAWFPGLNGTVTTPLPRVGERSVELGSGSVFSSLDAVPVMLAGEARYGRFALVGDIFHATIARDVGTRDLLFQGGHTRVTSTFGTILGMLQVVDTPQQGLEVGAGTRIWGIDTKLSLSPGLLPGVIQKTSQSWADPILAARYRAVLAPAIGVTLYADVGGFGAGSRLTWQAAGSLDYDIGASTTLRAGWRYLTVEKTRGAFGLDLGFNGPFFAATFRF